MKTITSIASLLAILFLGFSCVGPQGENGYDGIDGQDGIANVRSAIYDVNPTAWQGNIDGFITRLDVPEITNKIYLNGAVLVYILNNSNASNRSFNQLPYTWLYQSVSEYMDFDAYLGYIDISLRLTDNGINNTEAPNGVYTFKVILIEGTSLSVLKTQTDISNPEAVLDFMSTNSLIIN